MVLRMPRLDRGPTSSSNGSVFPRSHPDVRVRAGRRLAGAPGPRARALGVLAVTLGVLAACGCSDPDAPIGRAGSNAEDMAQPTPAPPFSAARSGETPVPLAETRSPDARVSTHRMLEADLQTEFDPADGGGEVELVRAEPLGGPGPLVAGQPARIELRYTAGPLGVAEGGTIFLQPSPFWDWSSPQTEWPDAPGYTEITTQAAGVELVRGPPLEGMVAVTIAGRALAAGEQLAIVYGAGESGALVDRYAEREAEISVAVDGNGDGDRRLVGQGARVDVVAGPPARLVLLGPTVVRPGERFSVDAHVLDAMGSAGLRTSGRLVFEAADGGGLDGLPAARELDAASAAGAQVELVAPSAVGVHRVVVRGEGALAGLSATSNPIVVHATRPRVLWADLHGHSQLSDGTGTPEDYFAYARDVARLDVAALTDHDHWGLRFLDAHDDLWLRIKTAVADFHEPGRFVTLLGYEWTSWLHGHRHVLYFEDDGPVLSSLDPAYANPALLWEGLRGRSALTFAHHSAGGPVATNWHFGADPVLEPVTEIVSVHGSSEAADSPDRIYSAVPGHSVRDVLGAGLRLGFIGSGDGHDGHPGLTKLAAPAGVAGLAAILAEERTREGVLAALRGRRSYATNGARIWLHVDLDGHGMGETAIASAAATQQLRVEVAGTAAVERIDLVRSGRVASVGDFEGADVVLERTLPRLAPGEWHYVRVVLEDGGVAWSSPIFVDAPAAGATAEGAVPAVPDVSDPPSP